MDYLGDLVDAAATDDELKSSPEFKEVKEDLAARSAGLPARLDEIHAAEREHLAMQADAALLKQTLDAQTSLLQQAQKDARQAHEGLELWQAEAQRLATMEALRAAGVVLPGMHYEV